MGTKLAVGLLAFGELQAGWCSGGISKSISKHGGITGRISATEACGPSRPHVWEACGGWDGISGQNRAGAWVWWRV